MFATHVHYAAASETKIHPPPNYITLVMSNNNHVFIEKHRHVSLLEQMGRNLMTDKLRREMQIRSEMVMWNNQIQ